MSTLKRFVVEDSGLEILEWALVTAILIVVLAPAFELLRQVLDIELTTQATLYDR